LTVFHRDSYYGYRIPRYVPRFRCLRTYKADLWGNYFFSFGGRWGFKRKAFRGKGMWLFLFKSRIARKFLRKINPLILRKFRRRIKGKQLAWYTLFRIKKFYPALKEGALRRYVTFVAKKTRYLYDTFVSDFLFFLEGRLDSIVWRTGFFPSPFFVRQLVRHLKIFVNFRVVSFNAYNLSLGDIVTFKKEVFILMIQRFLEIPYYWFSLRSFLLTLRKKLSINFLKNKLVTCFLKKKPSVFF